jgi:hypothetical protein
MNPIRRRFLQQCLLGVTATALSSPLARSKFLFAADDPEKSGGKYLTPATAAAIERGLAFLAKQQQSDGAFGLGGQARNVAICGLSGIAMLSSGSAPGRGAYGKNLDRCIDFILANTQESGFITTQGVGQHGPMYGHGFATLFLAESYGMTPRADLREKLKSAVNLIVSTQNQEGGWRYQPIRSDADLSVTIAQVMALRAARNAGIHVPKETVDRCIDYVKKSQNADGGFMYQLNTNGPSGFPRSAAGVVALYSAGIYEGPEVERGLNYLMQNLPRGDEFSRENHFFYGHYYAVQAMWHAGGEYWSQWYPAIRDSLLTRQRPTGEWDDPTICPEYATAMACIILQMPNNYLPIFQR